MWLTENHPDAVRCDYLLNEGAGAVFPFGDERVYGVCVAEKGVFRFTLTTDGVAGHASMPKIGDNALLKMAPLAAGDGRPPAAPTTSPRRRGRCWPSSASRSTATRPRALDALRERDPILARARRADARRDARADAHLRLARRST